jgi:transcriptional regulator with XRE-family HTH domain
MRTAKPPLAKRLKQAREARGLSQKALGIAAGLDEFVASTRMNQYEKNVHAPDYSTVRHIAKVLRVSPSFFYCDDDDEAALIWALSQLSMVEKRKSIAAFTKKLVSQSD